MAESPFRGEDYERMILANMQPNLWYERKHILKMIEDLGILRDVDRVKAGKTVDHIFEQRISNALRDLKNKDKLATIPYPGSTTKSLYSLRL